MFNGRGIKYALQFGVQILVCHKYQKKIQWHEGERLGQLVVTPEVVDIKIKDMKEKKSPGVDHLKY